MLLLIKERDTQMNRIKQSLINLINYIKLIHSFSKWEVIGGKNPEIILRAIKILISLESPRYPNTLYFGRDMKKSSELLQVLIDSYFETKSEVTLNQLLEVLKEEFIKREENNGRKQF